MFLDDDAFAPDDKGFKRRDLSPKREALTSKYGGGNLRMEDVDDDDAAFGSAGGLGVESNSRARMLAQQRDIQLKNRQKAMQSGGMIRSSLDEVRSSADSSQFTPAVRQFSAPKTVKDSSADAQGGEESSEFRVPPARRPVPVAKSVGRASRFSDDEDEEADDYRRRRQVRLPDQERNKRRIPLHPCHAPGYIRSGKRKSSSSNRPRPASREAALTTRTTQTTTPMVGGGTPAVAGARAETTAHATAAAAPRPKDGRLRPAGPMTSTRRRKTTKTARPWRAATNGMIPPRRWPRSRPSRCD